MSSKENTTTITIKDDGSSGSYHCMFTIDDEAKNLSDLSEITNEVLSAYENKPTILNNPNSSSKANINVQDCQIVMDNSTDNPNFSYIEQDNISDDNSSYITNNCGYSSQLWSYSDLLQSFSPGDFFSPENITNSEDAPPCAYNEKLQDEETSPNISSCEKSQVASVSPCFNYSQFSFENLNTDGEPNVSNEYKSPSEENIENKSYENKHYSCTENDSSPCSPALINSDYISNQCADNNLTDIYNNSYSSPHEINSSFVSSNLGINDCENTDNLNFNYDDSSNNSHDLNCPDTSLLNNCEDFNDHVFLDSDDFATNHYDHVTTTDCNNINTNHYDTMTTDDKSTANHCDSIISNTDSCLKDSDDCFEYFEENFDHCNYFNPCDTVVKPLPIKPICRPTCCNNRCSTNSGNNNFILFIIVLFVLWTLLENNRCATNSTTGCCNNYTPCCFF